MKRFLIIYLLMLQLSSQLYSEDKSTEIIEKYKNRHPKSWGWNIKGVITRLETPKKVIALTFDACGGENGSRYDRKIIEYLNKEGIPATLFISGGWIDKNLNTFLKLSNNKNFEIENHGNRHLPLSVNGKSAYGFKGTKSLEEIINEIKINDEKIYKLTGRECRFFRSGTAYYDEVAVAIVKEMGEIAVGFDIQGDDGGNYSKDRIVEAFKSATNGSIVIMHMNHPDGDSFEGLQEGIVLLKKRGFYFVKLEDYLK